MSITRRVPVVAALVLSAVPAWSQFTTEEFKAAQKDPGTYTLDESSIKIRKIGPTVSPDATPAPPGNGAIDPAVVLDQIINIGQKIWKIIDDNKPVVDVKTQYATALPKGVSTWDAMAGWKPPEGTIYELSAKNAYGITVIDVRYQVLRTYGGSYNGKGRYLTAVTVEPLLVNVAWAYHFSLQSAVPDTSIVNAGTSDDPVAAMMAVMNWRISTPLKDSQGQGEYYLRGDGGYKEIGAPFEAEQLGKAAKAVSSLEKVKAGSFE